MLDVCIRSCSNHDHAGVDADYIVEEAVQGEGDFTALMGHRPHTLSELCVRRMKWQG